MVAPENAGPDDVTNEEDLNQEVAAEETKMSLEVNVDERSACERHITVTISRDDIERYYDKEFSEMMDSAEVPGFRAGHAPRKLVERRFRKDVGDRVKSSLLMDSIAQVNDDEEMSAISEPDFDFKSIEVPEEGEMTFEFDLEVRPEFELPQWKGLKVEKPVREFSDADVDDAVERALGRFGNLAPHEGAAELGDYVTVSLSFEHNGQVLSSADEEVIRIRPVLSFRDGNVEKFDELMVGVKAGESREAKCVLTDDAPNAALRGKEVTAKFEVQEIKRLELPEMTEEFLSMIGDFESEADLRDAVKDNLDRQLEYHQRQRARDQLTEALTEAADWELPPSLLENQSGRELQRAVLELQRSGFSEEEIRKHENELRQNSRQNTASALKEHFILERIAENEEIEDEPADYETEIALIAAQSGDSPRRTRARLEKSGGMDALRNQIIERKVVDLILAEATFEEAPYEPDGTPTEAVDRAAGGGEPENDIPEVEAESSESDTEESSEE